MLNDHELSRSIAKHILEWPKDTRIVVVDTETSGTSWIDDSLVCFVAKDIRTGEIDRWHVNYAGSPIAPKLFGGGKLCLIGHNISFDLKFLLANHIVDACNIYGVWDTMVAEYILSGQDTRMASLDYLGNKYTAPKSKGSLISDTIAAGKTVTDINPSVLLAYCEDDVDITTHVFTEQLKLARAQDQTGLIKLEGMVTLAYSDMEMSGMTLDEEVLKGLSHEYTASSIDARSDCRRLLADAFGMTPSEFDSTELGITPRVISYAVFGHPSTLTYGVSQPNGYTKDGRPKFKKEKTPVKRAWPLARVPPSVSINHNTGVSLSEESIATIEEAGLFQYAKELLDAYKSMCTSEKILNTYVEKFREAHTKYGKLFPSINQTVTRTTRASSSAPNAQNIPEEVRTAIISQFGDEGCIVSIDYSQIEVCAAAQHTFSPNLIEHLNNGDNIHEMVQTKVYGRLLSDEHGGLKRAIKAVVFGTIYGGREHSLSKQSGLPVGTVKTIRAGILELYPELSTVPSSIIENHVSKNILPSYDVSEHGSLLYKGFYQCPQTKIRYTFQQEQYKAAGKARVPVPKWPYPKVADYPVQGLAAYLMKLYLVSVYLCLMHGGLGTELHLASIDPIMVVHDELVLDMRNDAHLHEHILTLEFIGKEVVPKLFKELTGYELVVPLKVATTVNSHWS